MASPARMRYSVLSLASLLFCCDIGLLVRSLHKPFSRWPLFGFRVSLAAFLKAGLQFIVRIPDDTFALESSLRRRMEKSVCLCVCVSVCLCDRVSVSLRVCVYVCLCV